MKFPEQKRDLLTNGRYQEINNLKKQFYKDTGIGLDQYIRESENSDFAMYEVLNQIDWLSAAVMPLELRCLNQLQDARRQKGYRIKEQLKYYIIRGYKLVFATFTFNDESIKQDEIYLKKHIYRLLNKCPDIVDYIGNVDYGEENERIHYHYILVMNKDFIPEIKVRSQNHNGKYQKFNSVENINIKYKKGYTTYELIGTDIDDYERVTKYITKLTLHAIKKTTENKLITKRQSPYHKYQKMIQEHIQEQKEAIQERKDKKRLDKINQIETESQTTIEDIEKLGGNVLWK